MAESKQIKSKSRVKERGEVFTNEREVKAMLDLVGEKSYDPSATFLEPSCGTGNFLIEILRRKISTVKKRCENSTDRDVYDSQLIQAISSIYAVDIACDNVEESRKRLLKEAEDTNPFGSDPFLSLNLEWVLEQNIVCGDMLDFKTVDGENIVFNQYVFESSDDSGVLDIVSYVPFEFKHVTVGKYKKDQKTEVHNEPCGDMVTCRFTELYRSKK